MGVASITGGNRPNANSERSLFIYSGINITCQFFTMFRQGRTVQVPNNNDAEVRSLGNAFVRMFLMAIVVLAFSIGLYYAEIAALNENEAIAQVRSELLCTGTLLRPRSSGSSSCRNKLAFA